MGMIYCDYNATTPVDESVFELMRPFFCDHYGNASSRHQLGRIAKVAIEEARNKVANAIGVQPEQIIFTSGGTESNNLALKGFAGLIPVSRLVVSPIEHASVRVPAHELAWLGWELKQPRVNSDGVVDLEDMAQLLTGKCGLVSVMLANNETGVIQPVADVVKLAQKSGVLVHTDAVQAFGKMRVDFDLLGVDALSIAGHKIYGPKGVGALVIRKGVDLMPVLTGASHERGLRAGTENVAGIVGLGEACRLVIERMNIVETHLKECSGRLETGIEALGGVIFGRKASRVPNTSYFAFENIDGPVLAARLDDLGFCVATGSACSSGKTEPSPVLDAMGIPLHLARGAIRVSLGMHSTIADIEQFLSALNQCVSSLHRSAACA